MIRFLGAIALASLLLSSTASAASSGLHPRCNIDWPCAVAVSAARSPTVGYVNKREARRIARADRFRGVEFGAPMYPPETARTFLGKSSGLVAPLAAKIFSIQSACPGTSVISGIRHTRVAGTRRWSLHTQGKAADVRGPYGCIYAQLRGWSGGYSIDAGRMRHIHISYDAEGGREMGLAFRHGGSRHARRHHRRSYATASH